MAIRVRLGQAADVDAALSIYQRSSRARHQGVWPNRAARIERVRARLLDSDSWFLLASEGSALVGMACVNEYRVGGGSTDACFLTYIYVVPDRWREGIGGVTLDAVLAEAKRRGYSRIHLWTDDDNERSASTTRIEAEPRPPACARE